MSEKLNFASDQNVRWCPGCGDYAILKTLQKTLAELAVPKENIVIVSGIGCAGRLPYYMSTYGIHGLHGRAPAIATGLKLTRPELSVWIVTGDGDGLSIGANHLYHCLRRDIDVNILLFNNRVYGLTKGQFSPTSKIGQITPTSPRGVQDRPVDPIQFALAAGAGFVARALDVDHEGLAQLIRAAYQHKGASFIEIFQNCPVFNDKAFDSVRDKTTRADNMLWLNHGEAMCFGQAKEKALMWENDRAKVIDCAQNATLASVAQHRVDVDSIIPAWRLTELSHPEFPIPFGIFRQFQAKAKATAKPTAIEPSKLNALLRKGNTWKID